MESTDKVDLKAIGERFRQVRISQGLTQGELGHMLGLNRTTVTNIEKGVQGPTIKTMILLDETFDTSIKWLLTGKSGIEKLNRSQQDALHIITAYLKVSPDFLNQVTELFTELWKPFIDANVFHKTEGNNKSNED